METCEYMNITAIISGNIKSFDIPYEESDILITKLVKENFIVISELYKKYENNGDICKCSLIVYIPRIVDYSSILPSYEFIEKAEQDIYGGDKRLYNYHSFDSDYDYYNEKQAKIFRLYEFDLNNLPVDDHLLEKTNKLIDNINNDINTFESEDRLLEIINNNRNVSDIFLYFINEKLGLLSNYEKLMFKYYREFNLKRLLIDNLKKYPLNNDNSGVISIFEDKVYKSALTKMNHINEIRHHLIKYGYNINDKIKMTTVCEVYNVIIVKIIYNTLIIWAPKKFNMFQKENLLSILEETRTINNCSKDEIEIYFDRFNYDSDYSTDVIDVYKYVKRLK